MVDRGRLVAHLNQTLRCSEFQESAINGMQVSGKKQVETVAFAVDGVLETIEKAAELNADMLLVHHGIYWGFQYALRGPDYKRVKVLMENDISLYAAHLPMDAHETFGHASNLLRALGATNLEPFGNYKGQTIGFMGEIKESKRDEALKQLETVLDGPVNALEFGPGKVSRVACVTGQGADFALMREAKMKGIHLYISGEANHPIFHYCKENQLNLALGGHYRTEVFGLKAIQKHLEETFDLKTVWIDAPSPF